MSARTKSATYFLQVVGDVSDIAMSGRKLAEHLHQGLKELWNEVEGKNMVSEWEKAAIDIETQCAEKLQAGETISDVWPAWKVRKSQIKRALKEGRDPNKYKNLNLFYEFGDGKKQAGTGKPEASKDGSPSKVTESNKGPTNTVSVVADTMPPEVRKRLDKALKELAKLPEAEALAVLDGFNGAIFAKLRKIGGRFANVGSKTA